jgi:hypothetical protein
MADIKKNLEDDVITDATLRLLNTLSHIRASNEYDVFVRGVPLTDIPETDKNSLAGKFREWLVKEKAGGNASKLSEPGVLEGLVGSEMTDVTQFVETFLADVKLGRTTDHVLSNMFESKSETELADNVGNLKEEHFKALQIIAEGGKLPDSFNKNDPEWKQAEKYLAMYQDMCVDLKHTPDIDMFKQVIEGQSVAIILEGGLDDENILEQANYANFVVGKNIRRGNIAWKGHGTDNVNMKSDGDALATFRKEFELRSTIGAATVDRDKEAETDSQKEEYDKDSELYRYNKNGTMEINLDDDTRFSEREMYEDWYQQAHQNIVDRLFKSIDEEQKNPDGASLSSMQQKADTINQIQQMCRVLGVSEDQLCKKIIKIDGDEKASVLAKKKGLSFEDARALVKEITPAEAMHSELWQKIADECKDKKTAKGYEKLLGKGNGKTKLPVDSKFFSQALRECIIDNATDNVYRNKKITATLEDDRRGLELALTTGLKQNGTSLTRADAENFAAEICQLGEKRIPDLIYGMMASNLGAAAGNDQDKSQIIFNLLTSGSVDTKIIDLEKQLREKYKGIDFDQQISFPGTDGKGWVASEGTLGQHITQMYARQAQRHVDTYMENIAGKSKQKTAEGKQTKKDANEVFDVAVVKERTGAEIDSKGEKSSKYYSPVSKCPYRALALANKMITQLAQMMCKSFQKTIASGGFYEQRSQEDFFKLYGYGENLENRTADLQAFFFGKASTIEKSNDPNSMYVMLCKHLDIDPKKHNELENLIKNEPMKVEDALGYVEGLPIAFEKWRDIHGAEAKKAKEEKAEAQFDTSWAEAKEMLKYGDESEKRAIREATQKISRLQEQINNAKGDPEVLLKQIQEIKQKILEDHGYADKENDADGKDDDGKDDGDDEIQPSGPTGDFDKDKFDKRVKTAVVFNSFEIARLKSHKKENRIQGGAADKDISYLEERLAIIKDAPTWEIENNLQVLKDQFGFTQKELEGREMEYLVGWAIVHKKIKGGDAVLATEYTKSPEAAKAVIEKEAKGKEPDYQSKANPPYTSKTKFLGEEKEEQSLKSAFAMVPEKNVEALADGLDPEYKAHAEMLLRQAKEKDNTKS